MAFLLRVQTSASLPIDMGWVYLATPIGMALAIVRIIQQLILQIKAMMGKEDFQVKTEQELILEDRVEDGKDEVK